MAAAPAATSSGYSVSLGASITAIRPGGTSTLTAYSSVDVGPTIYYIEIFDTSAGQLVGLCGSGTTCSGSVSQSSPTRHAFTAYISADGGSWPPSNVQATSNSVNVTWLAVSLSASPYHLGPGGTSTLTATANADIGPTPWYIEIFDQTRQQFLADCWTGSSCSTAVTSPTSNSQDYVAYVSSYGTGYPPPSVQATSGTVTVYWVSVYLHTNGVSLGPSAYPGSGVTLDAEVTMDVGPTPYYAEIFDTSAGARVAICGTGFSCAVTITQSTATTRGYVAYVAFDGQSIPPPGVIATSNSPSVAWANWVPGEWFAGPAPDGNSGTDPINLVIHEPGRGATAAFINSITVWGPAGWFNNTCYNTSVRFYSGHDPNPANWALRSPDGSYATNVDEGTWVPGYSGCGSDSVERDHLRYWTSSDDTTVWVASSYEYRCIQVNPPSPHCLSTDAFNRGRDTLDARVNAGLSYAGFRVDETRTALYAPGVIDNYGNSIPYDGQVDVVTVTSNVYNPPSSEHAAWVSDSYDGAPLTSITLRGGQVSDNIYVTFHNQGPANWDSNTVLAFWTGGTDDGQPADGTEWCHSPVVNGGNDWLTCNPGVPAWIGNGRIIQPGAIGLFEFQIQAPQTGSTISTTLYFRPAQRLSDGTYAWIWTAAGHRTYDYFTVLVNP